MTSQEFKKQLMLEFLSERNISLDSIQQIVFSNGLDVTEDQAIEVIYRLERQKALTEAGTAQKKLLDENPEERQYFIDGLTNVQ